MPALTDWVAPEEGCACCHGEDGDLASDDRYAASLACRMVQMAWVVNANWTSHVGTPG
ncbi:MAG: photosynthetic reaction center cytochrome c subunit family protein [Pseudomonadota bacterium]